MTRPYTVEHSDDDDTDEDFAGRLADYVKRRDYVSFRNILDDFPEAAGPYVLGLRENLVLYEGLSAMAIDTIRKMIHRGDVHAVGASWLTYLADGGMLRLPRAKRVRAYAKPHWLPVTLRAGPGKTKPPRRGAGP